MMSKSSSLALPDHAAVVLPASSASARVALRGSCAARRPLRRPTQIRAELGQPKGLGASLRSGATKFLQRYDPVTTGIGSLLVTGYCVVVHEQSVGEALNIAACATVLGMVLQEVLFNDDTPKGEL